MENVIKKTNKATLLAAALIITGATAIFGTYAAENEPQAPQPNGPGPLACYQVMNELTAEQKAALEEAHNLMQSGDKEGAKEVLDAAGIKPPRPRGPRPEFMENLTDEQRERLQEARELMRSGDTEAAQAIFDELGIERPEKRPGNGFGRKPWQQFKPQNGNANGNE